MKLDKINEAGTEYQTTQGCDPWRRETQESHIHLGFLPGGTFQITAQEVESRREQRSHWVGERKVRGCWSLQGVKGAI